MTQPRVVAGLDRVCRGLGGVSRVWRFNRIATVCHPESERVTASIAGVAKSPTAGRSLSSEWPVHDVAAVVKIIPRRVYLRARSTWWRIIDADPACRIDVAVLPSCRRIFRTPPAMILSGICIRTPGGFLPVSKHLESHVGSSPSLCISGFR